MAATSVATLVEALDAQWQLVVAALADVSGADWDSPSVLPGWRVADIGGHLVRSAHSADELRAAPPGSVAQSVADYTAQYAAAAADIAAGSAAIAAHRDLAEILDLLRPAVAVQVELLRELGTRADAERLVVAAARGPIRLADFVATRLLEVVVHADDLARSVGVEATLHRPALRVVTRMLTAVLAERHPGHAVEFRVPPFAAVQCVTGPRHTRGTPPNVVEADPLSWLRLATGRLAWVELVADGRVRASGDRSDLSALLPLL